MKQLFSIHGAFLLAVMAALLMLSACKRDLQINPTAAIENVALVDNVQSAKTWFDNNPIPNDSKFKGMKPDWSNAIATDGSVEVPFSIGDRIVIPTLYPKRDAHWDAWKITSIYAQKQPFLRLFERHNDSVKR